MNDPRELILKSPMSRMQILVVAITIWLNALDGFDVLAISLASTGIAQEFSINRAALGFVLAMELIGMAAGSILLGGVADRFGRRPTMLGCLVVMSLGMFMVTMPPDALTRGIHSAAQSVGLLGDTPTGLVHISVWRVITGLGIGGMLAAINAVVAEYSNAKCKHMNVAFMAIGYPVGAAVGSQISAYLLQDYSWRSVFYLGFGMTVMLLPIVFFLVPETVQWLAKKRPAGALEKINSALKQMGHGAVSALPEQTSESSKESVFDIFSKRLIAVTLILTAAYFFHITTFYFIIKWVPDIIVRMGFDASNAASTLFWVNVGGATGGALLGLLTLRLNLKLLTIGAMLCGSAMVVVFGRTPADLTALAAICCAAGFFTNAAINGMYAIFAHTYPTHVRAAGTGFAIGVGRGGSVLAPIVAGFLFTGGVSVPNVAVIMACGSLIAAGLLVFLKLKAEPPEAAEAEPVVKEAAGAKLEEAPA